MLQLPGTLVFSGYDQYCGFYRWLRSAAVEGSLPYSLRGVRDSFFRTPLYLSGWEVWLLLAAAVLSVVGIVLWNWRRRCRKTAGQISDNADTLFDELLGQVTLCASDKKILREMAKGARLKYPVMCMLSPEMLDLSRRLWRQEKGPRQVTREKYDRIDAIAVQLYDHYASGSSG